MTTMLRRTLLPALMLVCTAAPAFAALVGEVRDDGGFFSKDAIERANDLIKDIHKEFKKDLVIETFKSIPADRAGEFKNADDKAAKNKAFNSWARDRARALEVNGVYILICKDPGHLEVEVGNETQKKAFTLGNRDTLAARMIDKFKRASGVADPAEKRKLYDEALVEGAQFVYDRMKSNLPAKAGAAEAVPFSGESRRPIAAARPAGGGFNWGGLLCMGLIGLLVVWVVVGLIRSFSGGGGGYGPGMMGGGWGGGGGGFMTSLLGGMFGAAAGMWMYNNFFGSGGMFGGGSAYGGESGGFGAGGGSDTSPQDTDYSGTGGDFNDGGGDAGGGGGGDFGGGGGDFGGGGGDFGGGGGDFGGGGGDF